MSTESRSTSAVAAARNAAADEETSQQLQDAVSDGIAAPPPVFNTHSTALAAKLNAEAEGYKNQVADIDAQIATLNAQRTDLMLAYSMLSAAMAARERRQ